MIRRLARSRGWRKFRRNRLAMLSLGIIALYLLAAMTVWLPGMVTREDTKIRVGPNRMPGFLEPFSRDQRVKFAQWNYDRLDRLVERFEQGRASEGDLFSGTALAERRLPELPPAEIVASFDAVRAAYKTFDETFTTESDLGDEIEFLNQDLARANEAAARAADLRKQMAKLSQTSVEAAELQKDIDRAERLAADAEELKPELEELSESWPAAVEATTTALSDLEAAFIEFQPMPTGLDGLVYKLRTCLGTESKGASISTQAFYAIKIAFQVGLVTAIACVLVGTILGAAAAFYGGWVDNIVLWIISTLSSIPYLVLLAVLVFAFRGSIFDNPEKPGLALVPLYVAFGSTFWISTARVIRGEVMKIKELEYVQAATAIGFGRFYILLKHVIPNTTHLMFINFSLLFIGAIKSEVILTFLGLGVKGQPSWGTMISLGADGVPGGFFWEVGIATVFMFGLVLAFNIVSDALQDAFDPRHVG